MVWGGGDKLTLHGMNTVSPEDNMVEECGGNNVWLIVYTIL